MPREFGGPSPEEMGLSDKEMGIETEAQKTNQDGSEMSAEDLRLGREYYKAPDLDEQSIRDLGYLSMRVPGMEDAAFNHKLFEVSTAAERDAVRRQMEDVVHADIMGKYSGISREEIDALAEEYMEKVDSLIDKSLARNAKGEVQPEVADKSSREVGIPDTQEFNQNDSDGVKSTPEESDFQFNGRFLEFEHQIPALGELRDRMTQVKTESEVTALVPDINRAIADGLKAKFPTMPKKEWDMLFKLHTNTAMELMRRAIGRNN